jgi:hypothetical protein
LDNVEDVCEALDVLCRGWELLVDGAREEPHIALGVHLDSSEEVSWSVLEGASHALGRRAWMRDGGTYRLPSTLVCHQSLQVFQVNHQSLLLPVGNALLRRSH